jgi:hypothetical protein
MSTKCTIGHGPQFHLYEECFDSDNVYLKLDGGAETSVPNWDGQQSVVLKIDINLWRAIVSSWTNGKWAQDESRDHMKLDMDTAWLEEFEKKHRE